MERDHLYSDNSGVDDTKVPENSSLILCKTDLYKAATSIILETREWQNLAQHLGLTAS